MAMLAFLAAAFVLPLPFRYVGEGDIFREVPSRLAFFGIVLFVPGMALGAVLGARTYRTPRRRATRVGAGVGAIVGWTSFFFPAWVGDPPYVFLPLALLATGLVLYALFAKGSTFEQRKRLFLVAAGIVAICGLVTLVLNFDVLGVTGAVFSTAAAALGGWVGGVGYARAGGDDMIPPGSTIRPREPRPSRRKPR